MLNREAADESGEDVEDEFGEDVQAILREIIALAGGSPLPDDLRPHRLLTPDLAAAYIGVSTHALRWWRWHGTGPAFCRVAHNRVGYFVADLDKWLRGRRVEPANRR